MNMVQNFSSAPAPAQDAHADLRARLLAEAEEIVSKQGLGALRARDLAQRAGCALGMIYKIFPDLHAIVLAVNSRTLHLLDKAIDNLGTDPDAIQVITDSDPPEIARLVQLALAYFDFAADNELRWRALFDHKMPAGQVVPDWHLAEHRRLFAHLEAPLRALFPETGEEFCMLLGRSLFSAIHGVVSLGLEEKLVTLPLPVLRRQTALIAAAASRGLIPSLMAQS
jgi:AcrR family transcriptional regulator